MSQYGSQAYGGGQQGGQQGAQQGAGYGGQQDPSAYGGQQEASAYGGQQDPSAYGGQQETSAYGSQQNQGQEKPSAYDGQQDPSAYGGQQNPIQQDAGSYEEQHNPSQQGQGSYGEHDPSKKVQVNGHKQDEEKGQHDLSEQHPQKPAKGQQQGQIAQAQPHTQKRQYDVHHHNALHSMGQTANNGFTKDHMESFIHLGTYALGALSNQHGFTPDSMHPDTPRHWLHARTLRETWAAFSEGWITHRVLLGGAVLALVLMAAALLLLVLMIMLLFAILLLLLVLWIRPSMLGVPQKRR